MRGAVIDDIIASAELGLPQADCARAAGIHPDTLESWLKQGREDETGQSKYAVFLADYEKAAAVGRRRDMEVIRGAAVGSRTICGECGEDLPPTMFVQCTKGHKVAISTMRKPEWTASAWRLERRDPGNFGRRDRMALDVHTVSRDDVAALVRRMYEILQLRTRDLLALVPGGDAETEQFLRNVRADWQREFTGQFPEKGAPSPASSAPSPSPEGETNARAGTATARLVSGGE